MASSQNMQGLQMLWLPFLSEMRKKQEKTRKIKEEKLGRLKKKTGRLKKDTRRNKSENKENHVNKALKTPDFMDETKKMQVF